MNDQKEEKANTNKLAIVSLIVSLLGILSFFLMFNWTHGEFLVIPTLLFGFTCLITGIISARQMIISREKRLVNAKIYMSGFGIVVGVCILLWFCIALFTHN